jgi:hypothetical protein
MIAGTSDAGYDYTTFCSHVHCEFKPDSAGSWRTRVSHSGHEEYGNKHLCKHGMHVEGKCGCECFDESFGLDFQLSSGTFSMIQQSSGSSTPYAICAEVAAAGDFGIIAAATHGQTVSQNCNSGFTTDVVGSKTCTHGVFSGADPTCTATAAPTKAPTDAPTDPPVSLMENCPEGIWGASSTAVQQGATAALSSTGYAYSCGIPGSCFSSVLCKPGQSSCNSQATPGCYTSLALAKAQCDVTSNCYAVWNKDYGSSSSYGNCFQMRTTGSSQGGPGVNAPLTQFESNHADGCGGNYFNWGYTYVKDNGGYDLTGHI